MANTKDGILLSDQELFYFGVLLEGENLIGIPEPFPGWLTEEIRDLLPEIQENLKARGLIQERDDHSIAIAAAVEPLLRAVALCDVAAIVTLATPQMSMAEQRLLYLKPPYLAELRGPEVRDNTRLYTLHSIKDYSTGLYDQIVEWWNVEVQSAPECTHVTLKEVDLTRLRRIAMEEGVAQAEELLMNKGVNREAAAALSRTLETAHKNGALIVVGRNESGWQTENGGLLEGDNGLWWLQSKERANQRLVKCTPCATDTFHTKLQTLLSHFV